MFKSWVGPGLESPILNRQARARHRLGLKLKIHTSHGIIIILISF